ncbi:MAG: chemotaxis protein CheA [Ruminococcaceae bacterium]|nr:chemotaxis protein CheA [Oscillospiraceae bacterium]
MGIVEPGMEAMLDVFVHETDTMLEELDEVLIESEKARNIDDDNINTIFRITHTIKGSAAMMNFEGMSNLAHSIEDVFYILRESPEKLKIVFDTIFDLVFQSSDFLKDELNQIRTGVYEPSDPTELIDKIHAQVAVLKGEAPAESAVEEAGENTAEAVIEADEDSETIHIFFDDGCQMENIRGFMIVNQLEKVCDSVKTVPANIENDPETAAEIEKKGLFVTIKPAEALQEAIETVESALSVKSYEVVAKGEEVKAADEAVTETPEQIEAELKAAGIEEIKTEALSKEVAAVKAAAAPQQKANKTAAKENAKQSLLSVNQAKLDKLMDLVGEIVTTESMVARNPDIQDLKLDNFTKSLRELDKLTDELQDIVMSIRMVPLQGTFHKMSRIVRDMSKKLDKKVELVTIGEDTEVDKTINDAIVDPLMHMVRNSVDHAIESPERRRELGKPETGTVTLHARNAGGEILIDISDDGSGLDAQKLIAKAKEKGILTKPESEYTEKEAFQLIMAAGFSTNSTVTEFSGRGVGMDVVRKNIEQINGSISIHSVKDQGTTFTIKIPLTIAIVDGMNIGLGNNVFTLPITSIKQLFRLSDESSIVKNTNGAEMIMIRGECYPIYRLHKVFGIGDAEKPFTDGLLIHVESGNGNACFFADELLGEYQVVVKPFPVLFNHYGLKKMGLSGCSILGDGSISLIIDAATLIANNKK